MTIKKTSQESVSIDAGFLASRCLDANEQLATSIIPRDVLFPELSECKEPPAPAAWWPDAALKLSKRLQGSALRDKLAQGTLLVAHPLLLQSTLTRSLVLVCEHDGQGDVGLVVNRPTTVTLRDGLEKREEGYSSQLQEVLEVFGDNVLWRGGDVSEKLGVLHPHGHLSRAKQVAQGLYWQCDLSQATPSRTCSDCVQCTPLTAFFPFQAARMVLQGKAEASDFKLFRGYCGWGSGQLDGEMDQNIWFSTDGPAVTSFALAGADSGKTGAVNVDELNEEVAKGTSVDDSDGLLHAERHWGGALSALGGEYAAMAGIPEEQLRWSDNLWSRNAAGLLADQILGEVDAMEEE